MKIEGNLLAELEMLLSGASHRSQSHIRGYRAQFHFTPILAHITSRSQSCVFVAAAAGLRSQTKPPQRRSPSANQWRSSLRPATSWAQRHNHGAWIVVLPVNRGCDRFLEYMTKLFWRTNLNFWWFKKNYMCILSHLGCIPFYMTSTY